MATMMDYVCGQPLQKKKLSSKQLTLKHGTTVYADSVADAVDAISLLLDRIELKKHDAFYATELSDGVWVVQYSMEAVPTVLVTVQASSGLKAAVIGRLLMAKDVQYYASSRSHWESLADPCTVDDGDF